MSVHGHCASVFSEKGRWEGSREAGRERGWERIMRRRMEEGGGRGGGRGDVTVGELPQLPGLQCDVDSEVQL